MVLQSIINQGKNEKKDFNKIRVAAETTSKVIGC